MHTRKSWSSTAVAVAGLLAVGSFLTLLALVAEPRVERVAPEPAAARVAPTYDPDRSRAAYAMATAPRQSQLGRAIASGPIDPATGAPDGQWSLSMGGGPPMAFAVGSGGIGIGVTCLGRIVIVLSGEPLDGPVTARWSDGSADSHVFTREGGGLIGQSSFAESMVAKLRRMDTVTLTVRSAASGATFEDTISLSGSSRVIGGMDCAPPAPRRRTSAPAPQPQRSRSDGVSARAMLAEYQANEIRASRKYEGRTVRVSGVIESIGSSLFGGGYFTFEVDAILAGVQVQYDDEDILVRLSRGQRVTVTCRDVSGGSALGVVLDDCAAPR